MSVKCHERQHMVFRYLSVFSRPGIPDSGEEGVRVLETGTAAIHRNSNVGIPFDTFCVFESGFYGSLKPGSESISHSSEAPGVLPHEPVSGGQIDHKMWAEYSCQMTEDFFPKHLTSLSESFWKRDGPKFRLRSRKCNPDSTCGRIHIISRPQRSDFHA